MREFKAYCCGVNEKELAFTQQQKTAEKEHATSGVGELMFAHRSVGELAAMQSIGVRPRRHYFNVLDDGGFAAVCVQVRLLWHEGPEASIQELPHTATTTASIFRECSFSSNMIISLLQAPNNVNTINDVSEQQLSASEKIEEEPEPLPIWKIAMPLNAESLTIAPVDGNGESIEYDIDQGDYWVNYTKINRDSFRRVLDITNENATVPGTW